MIAHLRGTVIEKSGDGAVIEAAGVGYMVSVTAEGARALPDLGREARLFIYTHAVQDGPLQLFGFTDPEERRLFETLLGVQGVGPKVAVAILSGIAPGDLVAALTRGDIARLTQIRGVGRKTAERLSVELRDKLGAAPTTPRGAAGGLPGAIPQGKLGDVYGALLSLGYRAAEFEGIVAALDPALPTADLVKVALSALRRK